MKIPAGQVYIVGGKNDTPANKLIHFSCSIRRVGEKGIHVTGVVESKIAGEIQFVQMQPTGKEKTDDFPEVTFNPGKTRIDFSGNVVAWIKEEFEPTLSFGPSR